MTRDNIGQSSHWPTCFTEPEARRLAQMLCDAPLPRGMLVCAMRWHDESCDGAMRQDEFAEDYFAAIRADPAALNAEWQAMYFVDEDEVEDEFNRDQLHDDEMTAYLAAVGSYVRGRETLLYFVKEGLIGLYQGTRDGRWDVVDVPFDR